MLSFLKKELWKFLEGTASIASACLTLCKQWVAADALQDEICRLRRNQFFRQDVGLHHAEGTAVMRPQKSLFNALLTHFLMGVALGLSLVLLLALTDVFHVRDLVAKSAAPVQTAVMLITTYGLMFGIGSALTGLVLTLEDES
jgi:hypothetical protein